MAEPGADDLAPQGQVHEDADALFAYLDSIAEEDRTAPPLYSGPHGDYTVHPADGSCDLCTPAYYAAYLAANPECTCDVVGPHRWGDDCEWRV